MPSTRLLLVSPFPPDQGGIAQSSAAVLDALGKNAHGVGWKRHYPGFLHGGNQPRKRRNGDNVSFSLTWYNPFSWIAAGIQARGFSTVAFAWVTPFDAVPYRLIASISRTETVAFVHNIEPHETAPFSRVLTRLFLNGCDRAVAMTNDVAAAVHKLRPGLRVDVSPHPPNVDIEPASMPPHPPIRILHPGFVRPYKGADIAVRALGELRASGVDAELLVRGEFWGVGPRELKRLAQELGIPGSVTITDEYVSDADMSLMLQECHIVVLPYRSATQSGLVPLATASHRPVVVTPVGGLPEQVQSGISGAIASDTDPASVATALESVVGDLDGFTYATTASWDDIAAKLRNQ